MKIPSRHFAIAAAWIIAIAVGFMAGRKSNPGADSPSAARTSERSGAASASSPGSTATRGPGGGGTRAEGTRGDRPAGLAREKSPAALRDLLTNPDRLARTRALLALVDRLAPDEFQGVVEALRSDPLAAVRRTEYYLLVNAWVEADPYAAAEYLLESDSDGNVRESALAAWAAKDPHAAAEWAKDKKDGGSVNNWAVGLIRGVASTDPDAARALLEGMPQGRTRTEALQDILPYVTQNGFDFTTAWLGQIGDEAIFRETSRRVARSLTRMDAAEAGQWVTGMENVPARRDASEEVADQWARENLEAARTWAENLPQDTRTEAAEGVVRHMARQDPERAAQWLGSLDDSPDLDGARYSFLEVTQKDHPQVALETAAALHKDSDRLKWYGRILGNWSKQDSQTSRAWVETNAAILPERLVSHYLKAK